MDVPGLGQKFEWPLGKKLGEKARKSRNTRKVSGGGVGAEGMVTKGLNRPGHGTNAKRSQIAFAVTSIALTLASLGIKLLELPDSL